jgi:8-oxo-dGTP diphosphatase
MTVHLVRHADAGAHRDLDDELRPLSKKGRRQADAVRDTLTAEPVARILSSRYVRCVETMRPLAEHDSLPVDQHPALAEEADVKRTWDLIESLSAEEGDSVVCSHGNVLSAVLDRVHRRGIEVVADEWSCRKGSIWRLETGDGGALIRLVLALRPG